MTPKELKDFRKGKNMNQADLAKALGKSRKTIVNWEGGLFAVPSDIMAQLAAKGLIDAAPVNKLTATDKAAIAQYALMREQPGHSGTPQTALAWWQKHNFTPSPTAQEVITASFPDAVFPDASN